MTAERETPVRVLLERHLIDLQLQNAPQQYLIGRVLARLMELERGIWVPPATTSDDAAEGKYWKMVSELLADWVKERKEFRPSMTASEILDRAQSYVYEKMVAHDS